MYTFIEPDHTGDTQHRFSTAEEAEKFFNHQKRTNLLASGGKGGTDFETHSSFDPNVDEYIIMPPIQGG